MSPLATWRRTADRFAGRTGPYGDGVASRRRGQLPGPLRYVARPHLASKIDGRHAHRFVNAVSAAAILCTSVSESAEDGAGFVSPFCLRLCSAIMPASATGATFRI